MMNPFIEPLIRNWTMTELPPANGFKAGNTYEIPPKRTLVEYNLQMPIEVAKQDDLPEIYKENVSQKELSYIIIPNEACSSKKPYVALIKTAYHERHRRNSIRNMFASMLDKSEYEKRSKKLCN